MFGERTSVGLDVHARSVVAAAIDGVTGELFQARLTPSHDQIRSWIGQLPGPVAVAYEAGPTGFGLARALTAAGVRCVVAAPSKLQRPSGDRVKTDARDAVHLARLLRLGEIAAGGGVPSVDQEAARDLVRAREDVRGDLMRARHRLSKLLLRQGIVYSGGHAWTGGARRVAAPAALRQAGRCRSRSTSAYETVLATLARRDRLDEAIAELAADRRVHPGGAPAGLPARGRDADRVRAGGGDRRLAPVHRQQHRLVPRPGPARALLRRQPRCRARSPRPATPTPAGCWSRRPGTTAAATGPAEMMRDRWDWPPAAARARGDAGNRRLHERWRHVQRRARSARSSPTSRSPANWPAGAGRWPSWTDPAPQTASSPQTGGSSAWSDPRPSYEQPGPRPGHARP